MTRRAAAGVARSFVVLLVAGALCVVVTAVLLSACGGSSDGASPEPTTASSSASSTPSPSPSESSPAPLTTLSLYFLRDGELGVAARTIPLTVTPANAAMDALLDGPNQTEVEAGLATDIPSGTRLRSLSITDGVAKVDLTAAFATPAARDTAARRVAEVVYTLTRFATVDRVVIKVDGEPLNVIPSDSADDGDGLAIDGALDRGRPWSAFEPAIFVESPGVDAAVASPFVLRGTASVFEGSFAARLVDASGRRIVAVTVQASRGAPGRGRFAHEIPFSTSAASGTLIVYSQSMEDGSRQNEVRVPISFVQ